MKKYNLINNALGWLCFVVAAVTYLLTIEPTASFWDCPEFIAQGAKLEIGHPPGNPIFMLTARFFVTIFGGDITNAAIAVNSMSALLSAGTILLLFWTITQLIRRIVVRDDATEISWQQMVLIMGGGLCGALAYTWSDTFWFSAVEGEVYAFSSFCTALVFWLILKWENHVDEPHSDRYIVLIAYVIGVSIAVHLLNLLCIPAIVLVFYYRKYKNTNATGSLIALGISFVLVALILFGLVPGFVKVAQGFELFFVNVVGLSYNMGAMIYAILLLAVFIYTIWALYKYDAATAQAKAKLATGVKAGALLVLMFSGLTFISDSWLIWVILFISAVVYLFGFCKVIPARIFTVSIISIFVIFIGYSSYAMLLIRASADTPMNQQNPDNVFTLSSYLNREQYGQTPLLYGPVFADQLNIQQVPTSDGQQVGIVLFDGDVPQVVAADLSMRDMDGYMVDEGEYKYSKIAKTSPDQPDQYVKETYVPDYKNAPDGCMLFTRMYSSDGTHINGYKNWSLYRNEDIETLRQKVPQSLYDTWVDQGYAPVYEIAPYLSHLQGLRTYEGYDSPTVNAWKPSFADNMRYFFNYQLNHMYWRYFMWNFAGRQNDLQGNGEPHLGNWISGIPFIDNARLGDQSMVPEEYTTGNKGHNVFYMLPLLLGIIGLLWQSLYKHRNNPKRGIEQFWVVFFLFFMTGIAIVLYLNQPPGQPRERDYAFAGSFYAFAIWIGMGVPAISQLINAFFAAVTNKKKATDKAAEQPVEGEHDKVVVSSSAILAAIIGLLVPLQMVSQTWDDHDRSHRYTTRDFGENYLNSLDENAIIFTNGDNDTFPLWYAQEVEGVRPDVRVVNLSYLSADWYANQQLHPYYDAEAIKMTAKPSDYAYDVLSYSFSNDAASSNPVPALEGLKQFYASAPRTYGKKLIKTLETPRMYATVDSLKAIKAFNINPNSSDSITKLPYLGDITMDGLNSSAIFLNKLLSFDIIANSINDGFERPVYFATTVPSEYYLSLMPNLSMTGLAYQVTPFANAPASPLADKAYENIVSKYRWGGLDDTAHNKGLYLDETVRRMVATVRNSMVETAQNLMINGDLPATDFAIKWAKDNNLTVPKTRADMARYLLDLMEEKLPSYVTAYDPAAETGATETYIQLYVNYGNADDLKKAEAIIDKAIDRYAKLSRYAISLQESNGPFGVESLGYTRAAARYNLPLFIGYKNYIDLFKALSKDAEANAENLELLKSVNNVDSRYNISPYIYGMGMTSDEITQLDRRYPRAGFHDGVVIAHLHDVTGVDPMKYTKEIAAKYGFTPQQLGALVSR